MRVTNKLTTYLLCLSLFIGLLELIIDIYLLRNPYGVNQSGELLSAFYYSHKLHYNT